MAQMLMDAEGKTISSTVLRGVNVAALGAGSNVVVGNWKVTRRCVPGRTCLRTGRCCAAGIQLACNACRYLFNS